MSEKTEKRDLDLESRSSELDRQLKEIDEKAGRLANIRGVCFLGVLAFVILYFYQDRNIAYLICGLVLLVLFVVFVWSFLRKSE